MTNRNLIILGVVSLVLIGVGLVDFFTTDNFSIAMGGEDTTISYYLYAGVVLLILTIVGLVRGNRRIK